jgi:hypothetical protein
MFCYFCSAVLLDVLFGRLKASPEARHRGLKIKIKLKNFDFSAVNFFNFWSSKTWIWNRNHQKAGTRIRNTAFITHGPLLSYVSDAERHVSLIASSVHPVPCFNRVQNILKKFSRHIPSVFKCDSDVFFLTRRDENANLEKKKLDPSVLDPLGVS